MKILLFFLSMSVVPAVGAEPLTNHDKAVAEFLRRFVDPHEVKKSIRNAINVGDVLDVTVPPAKCIPSSDNQTSDVELIVGRNGTRDDGSKIQLASDYRIQARAQVALPDKRAVFRLVNLMGGPTESVMPVDGWIIGPDDTRGIPVFADSRCKNEELLLKAGDGAKAFFSQSVTVELAGADNHPAEKD